MVSCVLPDSERRIAKADCSHKACRTCIAAWVAACLEQQTTTTVRCPFDGCLATMYGDDIRRIDCQLASQFRRLAARDHRGRLGSLKFREPEVKAMIDAGELRSCPRCGIVVARSDGCNSMTCTCGTAFCFGCGYERCGCIFIALGWVDPAPAFRCNKCKKSNLHGGFYCYACKAARFPKREPSATDPAEVAQIIIPTRHRHAYSHHAPRPRPAAGGARSHDHHDHQAAEARPLRAAAGGARSHDHHDHQAAEARPLRAAPAAAVTPASSGQRRSNLLFSDIVRAPKDAAAAKAAPSLNQEGGGKGEKEVGSVEVGSVEVGSDKGVVDAEDAKGWTLVAARTHERQPAPPPRGQQQRGWRSC